MSGYKTLDHDADVGVRVTEKTLSDLFLRAAEAMFDQMVSAKREFIPAITVPIDVHGDTREQLLVRWLEELLFLYEQRRLVLSYFWIDELSETKLVGGAKGLKFDATRHEPRRTIKAVTYHQLKIVESDGTYAAQIIFDL